MNLVHFQLGYLIIKRKTQISRDFKNDYTDEFKIKKIVTLFTNIMQYFYFIVTT